MKIAFLIPSTTKNRPWKKMEETYLYTVFGKSFLNTLSDGIDYSIYINIDDDDPIYSKKEEKEKFERIIGEKAKIKWIEDGYVQKGFLTLMWNYLFEKALEDNNEYFYQCGDDIWFANKDWIKECIVQMKKQNDIGICGPINPPNYRILTQTFVSRKHYEIFQCYFPVQIKNWWCDDWINYVYYPHYVTKLKNLNASNKGGEPRYSRPNETVNLKYKYICLKLVKKGKNLLNSYITGSK
jgi:hypothetical protein